MKNKKIVFCCILAAVISTPFWQSCEKIILDETESSKSNTCQVTFNLFTPSVSRATSVADFKSVWVVDMIDDKVVQIVEQKAGQTPDFGAPTLQLASGIHTLRFFATDATNSLMEGDVVTQQPLGDTFVKSIVVDTKSVSGTQRVVLERQVAKVMYIGEGSITLKDVRCAYNMQSGQVADVPTSVTLQKDESLYTLIPSSGSLTLTDGTAIPVAANQVTRINVDGSHEGGDVPTPPSSEELLVLENDTSLIYVAEMEFSDVSLSEYPNPSVSFAKELGIYRIPTRREALVLHEVILPDYYWTGDRCLCYDTPLDAGKTHNSTKLGTGKYYTFLWGSGSVTSAGLKTAYTIKPIRSVPLASLSLSYDISADFTWSTDTTEVK